MLELLANPAERSVQDLPRQVKAGGHHVLDDRSRQANGAALLGNQSATGELVIEVI